MIKNWQEIDMEMFKEIFNAYWNGESWTLDKVLEFQYLDKIYNDQNSVRVYFGNGININEWKEFNKDTLELMNALSNKFLSKTVKDILSKTTLSMCVLEDGPRITPLDSSIKAHYDMMWSTTFGHKSAYPEVVKNITNPIILWYCKEGNYYNLGSIDLHNIQEKDKFVRLRAISLNTWKDMIYNYVESGFNSNILHIENDLPKEIIRPYTKP